MTSPFDWRNRPSKVVEELKKYEAKIGPAKAGGIRRSEQLTPKKFHVYSKAVPGNESK